MSIFTKLAGHFRSFQRDPLLYFPGLIVWGREGKRTANLDFEDQVVEFSIGSAKYVLRRITLEEVDDTLHFCDTVAMADTSQIAHGQRLQGDTKEAFRLYPHLIENMYVIKLGLETVGLLEFSITYNHILDQLILKDELIYVSSKHRNFKMLRNIILLFEKVAKVARADKLYLAFDNTEDVERKRALGRYLGFEQIGRTIYKYTAQETSKSATFRQKAEPFSWQNYRYLSQYRRCSALYLALYLFVARRVFVSAMTLNGDFLEQKTAKSYFVARIGHRKYDGVRFVAVDCLSGLGVDELKVIDRLAQEKEAAFILISLIDIGEDIARVLPDYEAHGFKVAGFTFTRTVSQ